MKPYQLFIFPNIANLTWSKSLTGFTGGLDIFFHILKVYIKTLLFKLLLIGIFSFVNDAYRDFERTMYSKSLNK